jgi:diguanylate cyclase (GGDEF)-like protein
MFRWRRSQAEAAEAARGRTDGVSDSNDVMLAGVPLSSDEQPGADLAASAGAPTYDQALDAFVQVLRALGQYSFDLEQETAISFSQQCEAWSRHLLTLAPPPAADGGLAVEPDEAVVAEAMAADVVDDPREWPSVLRFVLMRRRREQQHVNKALGDLRQSIWAFAQSLGTALVEDQRADNHFKSQIDRLKVALERPSIEELKKEVVSAASSMSRLVTQRQQTQRRRLDELGARVTDLAGQLREAKQENTRDPLTQLVNRKGFDDFLNRMVFMRDVFGEAACMLMIDADRFKGINDTYGHPGGDAVLKAIADCMVRSFPRKSDLVARYGGEEFAIILPDTSAQNARRLAERMLQSIRDLRIPHGSQVITVTVSIGVGQLGRIESVQDWLDRTDQALYRAKVEGRDRVVEARSAD